MQRPQRRPHPPKSRGDRGGEPRDRASAEGEAGAGTEGSVLWWDRPVRLPQKREDATPSPREAEMIRLVFALAGGGEQALSDRGDPRYQRPLTKKREALGSRAGIS